MMQDIFLEIGIIIILGLVGALLARVLRQPLIPAYIIVGAILGPGLGLFTNTEFIRTLSEMGIAFLLFLVGLELDLRKMKTVGLVSSLGGTLQTFSFFLLGFVIADLLFFSQIESMYIGLVLTFSSTLVVVKMLSDKKHLHTLHGKMVIGFLLVQDVLAVLLILVLTSLSAVGSSSFYLVFLAKGLGAFVGAFLVSKYVFPTLFRFAAKSSEILFLLSVSICFSFSLLFYYIGFSIVIGAFVAGVALANLPYHLEIIARVRPLRDFFGVLFFVSLGLEMVFKGVESLLVPLIVFTFMIIILKPLLIIFITSFFGYSKRTSFLTGLSLGQISEFSLIIVAIGLNLGHISLNFFSLVSLLGVITITTTSYFIKFDNWIYEKLSKFLSLFNIISKGEQPEAVGVEDKGHDVILCGYDNIGYSIFNKLKDLKKSFLVLDYNPDVIRQLRKRKIPCLYGDLADKEILERLDLDNAQFVISTIPEFDYNRQLLRHAKAKKEKTIVFVTSSSVNDAMELYDEGADYVILPHFLGADRVAMILDDIGTDITKIIKNKLSHMDELKKRIHLGHVHPTKHEHYKA